MYFLLVVPNVYPPHSSDTLTKTIILFYWQAHVVGNNRVNLKIPKEEEILQPIMPDNITYVPGDEIDGKYRTFEGIPRKTSTTIQESVIVEGKSKMLSRFARPFSLIPAEGQTWRKDCPRSFGLLLAFLSGVMMTTYSSLIKTLEEMDVMQVVVIRGLLQVSIMGGI